MAYDDLIVLSLPLPSHLVAALDTLVGDLTSSTCKEFQRAEAMRFAFQEFCFVRGYLDRGDRVKNKPVDLPAKTNARTPSQNHTRRLKTGEVSIVKKGRRKIWRPTKTELGEEEE